MYNHIQVDNLKHIALNSLQFWTATNRKFPWRLHARFMNIAASDKHRWELHFQWCILSDLLFFGFIFQIPQTESGTTACGFSNTIHLKCFCYIVSNAWSVSDLITYLLWFWICALQCHHHKHNYSVILHAEGSFVIKDTFSQQPLHCNSDSVAKIKKLKIHLILLYCGEPTAERVFLFLHFQECQIPNFPLPTMFPSKSHPTFTQDSTFSNWMLCVKCVNFG